MILRKDVIDCQNREFEIAIIEFDRDKEADEKFLQTVFIQAMDLAEQVNASSANNASRKRSKQRILINCIAGLLAEKCWKGYLNHHKGKGFVEETPFEGASNQIDLKLQKSGKSIEIRSSFPRNGIEFAISHPRYQFDVIGPYVNAIKIGEPAKHYYLRTLYPIDAKYFMDYFNEKSVKVYLTGGATWDMMTDTRYYIIKDFVPEDSVVDEASEYRVVPFSRALDTYEMLNIIED